MTDKRDPSVHPDYARRAINQARLAAVRRHAGKEVLDVGCGNGAYVLQLADEMNIRGVDYRPFDSWAERPERFQVSDAQDLDLADGSVDTILSFETLEHLPEPVRAVKEYLRVCRKNLILTVPNCALTSGMRDSGLIYNHWIDRTHVNFWELESICQLVSDAGFVVSRREHINAINLGPVVMEAIGLSGFAGRVGARLLRALQRRAYPMTCLLVADKPTP